jgi:hypothetical protein
MRWTRLVACLISVLPSAAAVAASDFNTLNFYIGGAVGRSDLETVVDSYGFDANFDKHADAWKAFAGLRPIQLVAAEIGYMDLGHPHISHLAGVGGQYFSADVQQRAETLSGLVFAPIPLPFLDLYARAGVARVHDSGSEVIHCPVCEQPAGTPTSSPIEHTSVEFLYGAGGQVKLSSLAIRIEYERMNDASRHPDLLSAGVSWTF